MFTFFTDRDGKYQLAALAESGFDPLSRTCRFMLTEEAHHMFVGETGVMRVVQRTGELMNELATDDPERLRVAGAIDLPTVQKYINFHYGVSVDLFGQEISTNAANYFTGGLKGRYLESRLDDDHRLTEGLWPVHNVRDGRIVIEQLPALGAVNDACAMTTSRTASAASTGGTARLNRLAWISGWSCRIVSSTAISQCCGSARVAGRPGD